MRTIGNQNIPQNEDLTNFPNGGIKNETDTESGTPVIEEVLGDAVSNLYKLVRLAGITPTETQDSEATQYQIVEALRLLTNNLNDKEQILSLSSLVWSIPINLSLLPDKYFVIVRASEDYDAAANYSFRGSGSNPSYNFTSSGFNANDELLLIIDQSGVRVINLTNNSGENEESLNTSFGTPLSFNSSGKFRYNVNGKLLTNDPTSNDLQIAIRTLSGNSLAEIVDMFILKDHVLCFTYLPGFPEYKFYQFSLTDLNTAVEVPTGFNIPDDNDQFAYCYTDGVNLFLTNGSGDTNLDRDLDTLNYNPAGPTIAKISNITLAPGFIKTSNVVVTNGSLYTLINSQLKRYNLATGNETIIADFETINGVIFNFNGSIYYTNGEVGIKWTL